MNTIILACTSMLSAVAKAQAACGTSYPVMEIDKKYHVEPSDMGEQILFMLESLPEEVDTVLVAMGFCGGAWQGISCKKRIVIPRVSDCVSMFLVTEDRFDSDLKEMGHMYLFGDREEGFTVHSIYENMKEEYSPETVDFMFERYFEYYYHLDIIDNGLYDCYDIDYVEKAQMDADRIHAELGYVEGSNILLEQLVSGNWDEKFAVYQPGEQITQSSFYEKSW